MLGWHQGIGLLTPLAMLFPGDHIASHLVSQLVYVKRTTSSFWTGLKERRASPSFCSLLSGCASTLSVIVLIIVRLECHQDNACIHLKTSFYEILSSTAYHFLLN